MRRSKQKLQKRRKLTAVLLAAAMGAGTIFSTAGILASDYSDGYDQAYDAYNSFGNEGADSDIVEESVDVLSTEDHMTDSAQSNQPDGQSDVSQTALTGEDDQDYGFASEEMNTEDAGSDVTVPAEEKTKEDTCTELTADLKSGLRVTAKVVEGDSFAEGSKFVVRRLMNDGAEASDEQEKLFSQELLDKYNTAIDDVRLLADLYKKDLAGVLFYEFQFVNPQGELYVPNGKVELQFSYECPVICNTLEGKSVSSLYFLRGYFGENHFSEVVNTEKGLKYFNVDENLGVKNFIFDITPEAGYYALAWTAEEEGPAQENPNSQEGSADANDDAEQAEEDFEETNEGSESDESNEDNNAESEEMNDDAGSSEAGDAADEADVESEDAAEASDEADAESEETADEANAEFEEASDEANAESEDTTDDPIDESEDFDDEIVDFEDAFEENTDDPEEEILEASLFDAEAEENAQEENYDGKFVFISYDDVNLHVEPTLESDVAATVDAGARMALKSITNDEDGLSWYGVDYNTLQYPWAEADELDSENDANIEEGASTEEGAAEENAFAEESITDADDEIDPGFDQQEILIAADEEEIEEVSEGYDYSEQIPEDMDLDSDEPYVLYVRSDMAQIVEAASDAKQEDAASDTTEETKENEQVISVRTEINGTTIEVSGPESSFPKGEIYEVSAQELTGESLDNVEIALRKKELEQERKIANYTAYDINLIVDGAIVQPLGDVNVTFTGGEVEEQIDGVKAKLIDVYHINEEEQSAVAMEMDVDTRNNEIEMTTDHFSIYSITTNEKDGVTITVEHYLWQGEGSPLPQGYKIYRDTTVELDYLMTVFQDNLPVASNYEPKVTTTAKGDSYEMYIIEAVDVEENTGDVTLEEEITAGNGRRMDENHLLKGDATYRIYYVPKESKYIEGPVDMYDYQVAPHNTGGYFNQNGYNSRPNFANNEGNPIQYGINANSNYSYAGRNVSNSNRFGMGGTGENETNLRDRYTNEANRYQAWDMESDGNHDYGKGYEGEITSNLIQGYNPTTQYLIMNGGLVDPGVFKDSGVTGNYHLTGYSLGFTQTGDNNVLSYVKDTHGTIVTNVKEETPPNQKTDYYKGKGPIPDTSIDFFPLDNLINPNHQDYNAKYLDYANNKSTYSNGPGEGGVHNDYFGMKYKIVFKIGEYVGPLSWYFTGDDDLWVILDAEADNCGTVVADAGGVHQPVRVDTDLWPYVLGINGNAAEMQKYNADPTAYIENADYDRNAEHSLTILWMERGATDSNCFMEYTLPGAHMVPVDAIPVDIDVRKVDSKTGKPLAGAEFNISRVLDGVTYDLGNYESGEDGVVNLGKYYDGVYLLKETKVPRGYLVEDVLYRITVANGDYTLERQERGGAWEPIEAPIGKEPLIPNVAYFELPMEGTKTDQNGNPLEGAKFKIYTDEELTKALDIKKVVSGTGESEVVTWYDETVSGSDGKFDITIKGDDFKEDLNYSNPDDLTQQKYELVAYLKETEAPEGYITDSQSHKIKFEIITRITKIDGSVVQEVVSFNVVHLCDDKESCLVSVDSRVIPGSDPEKIVFYLDYKNFAPPHNVPRISLSKTFKGLTLEQVVALKDTYQIALSAKANAPLSYADAIQIMDADGNLLDLDNLTSEQLKETGEYTFVWRMEGISTGIYKVTESGETVNGYGTIRRGFNEDREVDDTLWNFAEGKPAVTELDRSTYSTWQNGENKLLIAKLTMDYGYLVYTNEKLTMSQELEFVDYINSLSGKPVATYMNTYFYSDDDIRGDGIKYGSGNKLSLNDQGQLQVQNANAWEKFYGGDYAWDGKRVADIETSNEYVLTEMDLRKITLDNNEVEGAKFRLSKRKEGTVPSGQEKYEVVEGYENFAIINGTTGDYKELKDMKEGIYLLEETLAPVGCTLLDEKIYFQISWDSQNEKFTVRLCDEDGNDLTTTPYMWKLDENTFTLTIANHLHYALPQSGGHGIYLYTIFGTILMMLGAFVIYFGRRNGVGMY